MKKAARAIHRWRRGPHGSPRNRKLFCYSFSLRSYGFACNIYPLVQGIPVLLQQPTSLVDQRYIDLLEKVNNQLSMRWTPYSVTFTVLALLLGFLSIAAIVIIWYQGKEYRERLDATVREYRDILNAALEQNVAQFQQFLSTAREHTANAAADLDAAKANLAKLSGEAKEAGEQLVARLEKTVASAASQVQRLEAEGARPRSVGGYQPPMYVHSSMVSSSISGITMVPNIAKRVFTVSATDYGNNYEATCESCKQKFRFTDSIGFTSFGTRMEKCPQCGALNTLTLDKF